MTIEIILLDGTKYFIDKKKERKLKSVKEIQRQLRIYGYYEVTLGSDLKITIKKDMVKSVGEVK